MLKRWTYKPKQGAKNTSSPTSDDYKTWNTDHLRKECTARGFQLARDIPKEDRINRLIAHDEMSDKLMDLGVKDSALLPTQQTGTVQTKHCMFRLLNVLFHDKCCRTFSTRLLLTIRVVAPLRYAVSSQSYSLKKIKGYNSTYKNNQYQLVVVYLE